MFLIDTNVVSELRKPRPHLAVIAWFERTSDKNLHLSAMTLGELQAGVEITRGQYPAKAAEIEVWIDRVAQTWSVLALDVAVCRCWARLMHRRQDRSAARRDDRHHRGSAWPDRCHSQPAGLQSFGVPLLDAFQAS